MTPFVRIALFSICALLCSQSAQANKQEELERLRQRISTLQQDMGKKSDSKSEASDALRESERAISSNNNRLYKLNQQQREANLSLQQFQQQSKQLSLGMQQQQLLLAQLLHQQYLGGKQDYFKLILNNHDPNQATRELHYYEYIAQNRSRWLNTLRGNLANLNLLTEAARQKNNELTDLQAEQTVQKQSLLKEKNAHQQILKKISSQLKQQRQEIGRLQRNEGHLLTLLENLSRIVAQPAAIPKPQNNSATIEPIRSSAFLALKGKLSLPVIGKVTNKFGSRRVDSPVIWKGLFVQSAASQVVSAVASGRVIFADWLRGFGNLLIIDHGLGYMSLYGNNETLFKQVGDELQGGDKIAAVGNSGGNEHYGLYFELRHQGIPLDPTKWIRGRASKTR